MSPAPPVDDWIEKHTSPPPPASKKKKKEKKEKKEKRPKKDKKKHFTTLSIFESMDEALKIPPPVEQGEQDQGPPEPSATTASQPLSKPSRNRRSTIPQRLEDVLRRERDPYTGRMRLIKGTGEIIEEIVPLEQQIAINKLATQGDGARFNK
ncbi:nuclear RNA-splicing-associated protein-domain-containing protein [Chytridium lagenaria]|nr:nuclear RNA-splicing-associated protein-domain-containing protein [Chytridium lagenaria]